MKKGFLIFSLCLLTGSGLRAQQLPMYSQYYFNPFLYNPSAAGRLDNGNVFLVNRQQWTSIPGAPVTRALTVDGPMKTNKIGIGFSAYDDVAGIFERVGASLSYSYRLDFKERHSLRLGLSVGAADNRVDFTKAVVKDPNDPTLMGQNVHAITYAANFGLLYTLKDLEIGLAVPQLFSTKAKFLGVTDSRSYVANRHFIGTAKYAFHFKEGQWKLEPLVYAQYLPGAPMLLDGGVVATYREKVWAGLLYRHTYGFTASLGVRLHERLILGYAYDGTTGDISTYTGGTHEIMIGYTFGKKAGQSIDKTEQRLKSLENRVDKHGKKIDSLSTDLKTNVSKTDSAQARINALEDKIQDLDALIRAMKDSAGRGVTDGNKYMLNSIFFNKDNNDVLPSSYDQLNKLAEVLTQNPTMQVQIDGYADITGTAKVNNKISKARAEAVKFYLMSQGAKADQIVTKGHGTANPRADNSTEAGRRMNRRVELTILKK